MRAIHIFRASLLTVGLLLAFLSGCASSPSPKFHQLNSVQNKESITSGTSFEGKLVIAIGPVRIPDYVDRPQIVTRAGKNELKLSEFHRWAGSLESDIVRVLLEDISSLLPADHVSVVRWTSYPASQAPASYQVELQLERFEGMLGDSVLLKAQWTVFARNKTRILKRESLIREQIMAGSYDALVAAMSNALDKLSTEIADGVLSALKEEQTGR